MAKTNASVRVGKFGREVPIAIEIGREDTRWHVYPNSRPPRHIQAMVLGVAYQYRNGQWFRTPVVACSGPLASERLLRRIGALDKLSQLNALVSG